MSLPAPAQPKAAASVVLCRARPSGEVEVFLLRRHRKASFMSSSYVFPGGIADPGEDDPRVTAARELFEEAGVLLADAAPDAAELARWRSAVDGGAALAELCATGGASLSLDRLHYLAHWITPSVEPRRYSAQFFLAELPAGQTPSFDNRETVDEVWVTPAEALARARDLRLPPPQVRTFWELREAAEAGMDALLAEVARRAATPHPILPRFAPIGAFTLLLPWDPDYDALGQGDALTMPSDHPLATGPSRFVLEDETWKNVSAAASTPAG
jgi:8-oxo-dGTP pyrophosphatase MutT (NUDIX family)